MTVAFPTFSERRQAEQIERNRVDREVRQFQLDAQLALNDLVWALNNWHEITGSTDYLDDTVAGLKDDVSNLLGEMREGLDAVGLHADVSLETARSGCTAGKGAEVIDMDRIEEIRLEFEGYDDRLKLGLVHGTPTVGEFRALLAIAEGRVAENARPSIERSEGTPESCVNELIEALRSLRNEACAILGFEHVLRGIVGNTNVACLKRRVDEADTALSRARQGRK